MDFDFLREFAVYWSDLTEGECIEAEYLRKKLTESVNLMRTLRLVSAVINKDQFILGSFIGYCHGKDVDLTAFLSDKDS